MFSPLLGVLGVLGLFFFVRYVACCVQRHVVSIIHYSVCCVLHIRCVAHYALHATVIVCCLNDCCIRYVQQVLRLHCKQCCLVYYYVALYFLFVSYCRCVCVCCHVAYNDVARVAGS
jgi:hypothetical protein